MPTAAKLFGALAFGILGWFAAHVYSFQLPEGAAIGRLREITAGIGVISGWRIMGAAAGKGYYAAAGAGIRAGIVMVFFSMLGIAIYEMVLLAIKMRYQGPMEAVLGIFDLMIEYARNLVDSNVLATLFGGSVLGGWFAEFASKHWK
jgi:hypothetical protein